MAAKSSYKSYLEFKPTVPEDTLEKEFAKYAGDDGKMDASELCQSLNAIFANEAHFGTEKCRAMLAMMDRDKSGYLNLTEFKLMMKEVDVWKRAFVAFDTDKSGYIESYELSKVFKTIGFELSRQVLSSVVSRYGGRARRMGLDDFIHCCSRIVIMYGQFAKFKTAEDPEVAKIKLEEWMAVTMHY